MKLGEGTDDAGSGDAWGGNMLGMLMRWWSIGRGRRRGGFLSKGEGCHRNPCEDEGMADVQQRLSHR